MNSRCVFCPYWVNNRCSLTTCCKKESPMVLSGEIDYSNVVIRNTVEEGNTCKGCKSASECIMYEPNMKACDEKEGDEE